MNAPLRVDERQAAIDRGLAGAQRLATARGIWRSMRTMTEAAVGSRHPEYTNDEVSRATAELMSRGTD